MPINFYQRTAMVAALAACFPVLSHAAGWHGLALDGGYAQPGARRER